MLKKQKPHNKIRAKEFVCRSLVLQAQNMIWGITKKNQDRVIEFAAEINHRWYDFYFTQEGVIVWKQIRTSLEQILSMINWVACNFLIVRWEDELCNYWKDRVDDWNCWLSSEDHDISVQLDRIWIETS